MSYNMVWSKQRRGSWQTGGDENKADETAPSAAAAALPTADTPAAAFAAKPAFKEVLAALSEDEWKMKLTPEEYKILREKGTEAAGTGEYDRFAPTQGYFVCRACGNPLFSAQAKFKSGCGWPAFDRCYVGSVKQQADLSHGLRRVELVCVECKSHLGHLFSGEKLTENDQRHCVNSRSLKFVSEPEPDWLVGRGESKLDTAAVDRQLAKATTPAGGGAGSTSARPKSDLNLDDPALAAAWAEARGKDGGWCICSYKANSKNVIEAVAHGEAGCAELKAALLEEAVNYGVLPATVDGRPRKVVFCYIGECASAMKRGRAAMHAPHVEKYFDGTVGALPTLTARDELEDANLNSLLKQLCKGSKEAAVR